MASDRSSRARSVLPSLALLALVTAATSPLGCAADGNHADAGDAADVGDADAGVEGDWGGDGDADGDTDADADGDGGGDDGGDGDADADGDSDGDGDGEAGTLTAGEWRDLEHWAFWMDLAQSPNWSTPWGKWSFDPSRRFHVVVTDDQGVPIADARVRLQTIQGSALWEARSDNRGHAELFAGLLSPAADTGYQILVERSGQQASLSDVAPNDETEPHTITLDDVSPLGVSLDLMFVIDTTGSMGDELHYLQVELGDVITRVEDEIATDIALRMSVNFYRDHGDAYVVRSYPFTTDVDQVLGQLDLESANGGGDWEEAVTEALEDGVFEHDWRATARSRLLFVVLDAPPRDTPENRTRLAETVEEAARLGIRIIPVAASGIDKNTEFLLRHLDVATGGTYTFLTDDSGVGNPHLEPTVGAYEVEKFNDMLVRLIVESL